MSNETLPKSAFGASAFGVFFSRIPFRSEIPLPVGINRHSVRMPPVFWFRGCNLGAKSSSLSESSSQVDAGPPRFCQMIPTGSGISLGNCTPKKQNAESICTECRFRKGLERYFYTIILEICQDFFKELRRKKIPRQKISILPSVLSQIGPRRVGRLVGRRVGRLVGRRVGRRVGDAWGDVWGDVRDTCGDTSGEHVWGDVWGDGWDTSGRRVGDHEKRALP
jgi:hypothetical protein